MPGNDRNHAAKQENSAANLAGLDVRDAPLSKMPDVADGDLKGKTTDGEDDTPQPDRSKRDPQK